MVIERIFCDFVLYVKNGLVLIERIYRDEFLIVDILRILLGFWKRVIVLEIFEMCILRNFLFFVMLSDFLLLFYDNISVVVIMDIDGFVVNKDVEDLLVSYDSSLVFIMDNDNIVVIKDINDLLNIYDKSSFMVIKDIGD